MICSFAEQLLVLSKDVALDQLSRPSRRKSESETTTTKCQKTKCFPTKRWAYFVECLFFLWVSRLPQNRILDVQGGGYTVQKRSLNKIQKGSIDKVQMYQLVRLAAFLTNIFSIRYIRSKSRFLLKGASKRYIRLFWVNLGTLFKSACTFAF